MADPPLKFKAPPEIFSCYYYKSRPRIVWGIFLSNLGFMQSNKLKLKAKKCNFWVFIYIKWPFYREKSSVFGMINVVRIALWSCLVAMQTIHERILWKWRNRLKGANVSSCYISTLREAGSTIRLNFDSHNRCIPVLFRVNCLILEKI